MIDWEGLKAAYEKTTKGKWRDDNGYRVYGPITPMDFNNEYEPLLFETKHTDATGGDSTFCALVHNTFPAILAQHEADQKVIEAAKDALKKVRDWVTEDDGYSPELMIEREAEYQKKRPGAQFINTDYMAMLKALTEFDKVVKP